MRSPPTCLACTSGDKEPHRDQDPLRQTYFSHRGGGAVTINFWDMAWGNSSYFDVGNQLVKDFNNSHKGITVVYRGTPWANWYQTFTTAIGSGTQPDISTGASFMGAQFSGANDVLPLDDLVDEVKKNGQYNDYLPGVFAPMIYKGHTITWPWAIDIRIPFYRKDLFQQAGVQVPTTWDEWRAAAKKLTGNGKYGIVDSGADNLTQHMLQALMINNGAGLFTPDKKLDFSTNPLNIEALRFFANLVQDGSFDPASSGYMSADAIRAFSRGDAAMLVGGPGFTAQMDASIVKNVGLIPPIASPHGTKGTLYWVNNIIIYSATKHPNETKEFLLWWVQNNMPLWTKGGNNPLPIRTSYYQDPLFNTPIYQGIKAQYIPIAKSANAQAIEVFPALNPVVGSYLLGLGLALLLIQNFPLRGLFRVLLIIPWILSSIVTIVSWRWMIQDQHGTINVLLGWFHLGPIFFLSDTHWAVVSVIVIKIWRSFPFMMISLIAALQTIDGSLYEAARIDGAGRWDAFRSVTFPGIRNISIILWILMTVWCVNDFETLFLLTQGGPSNATENLMILALIPLFIIFKDAGLVTLRMG